MSDCNAVYLTQEERNELDGLVSRGRAPARTQTRARVLLLTDYSLDRHHKDSQIIDTLCVSQRTISRIRKAFVTKGLEGALYENPRPGRPPKITGDVEARLTVLACSSPPEGRSRWTLSLLADTLVELGCVRSISTVAVHKHLKKVN
jgi:putative transposase